MNGPHRIDVHNHMILPEYLAGLEKAGIKTSGGIPYPRWSPQIALDVMDRNGIRAAITSVSSPGVYLGDKALACALATEVNEASAKLVAYRPDRFGAFGHIPLPDVDGALRELEYLSDTLHMDGVVLMASIGGQFLGDNAFDPVYAELDRRRTVVFIHPTIHPSTKQVEIDLPEFMMEFMFDTTRAVANLVFSGTLERYPNIRFIIAHAGAAIPYLAERMSLGKLIDARLAERIPQDPVVYLKRLYYDTALSASPYAFAAMQALLEPSQILFGSDWPFAPETITSKSIADLQGLPSLDDATRAAIDSSNAEVLFPRFAST